MSDRIPQVTAADVDRLLRRDYPEAQWDPLRHAIDNVDVTEKLRVVAACLKNAAGSSERLLRELRDASGYYREILGSAEFPEMVRRWMKRDTLDDAELDAIRDRDSQQYRAWFDADE